MCTLSFLRLMFWSVCSSGWAQPPRAVGGDAGFRHLLGVHAIVLLRATPAVSPRRKPEPYLGMAGSVGVLWPELCPGVLWGDFLDGVIWLRIIWYNGVCLGSPWRGGGRREKGNLTNQKSRERNSAVSSLWSTQCFFVFIGCKTTGNEVELGLYYSV